MEEHYNHHEDSSNIGRWTSVEHKKFLEAIDLFDKDWRKIAEYVGTRNNVQCRTHAQKHFKRKEYLRRVPGSSASNNNKHKPSSDGDISTDDETEKEEPKRKKSTASKTQLPPKQLLPQTNIFPPGQLFPAYPTLPFGYSYMSPLLGFSMAPSIQIPFPQARMPGIMAPLPPLQPGQNTALPMLTPGVPLMGQQYVMRG
jgi:SHAQKYF class myb-like DNA-binding protein